jgi:hypothetical protein
MCRDRFAGTFAQMFMVMRFVMVVRRVRDFRDVNHRKQSKDERLHERHEHRERQQNNRHDKLRERREQSRNNRRNLLVGKHVRKQTNPERHRANQVTEQFDQENQRRNPPNRSG